MLKISENDAYKSHSLISYKRPFIMHQNIKEPEFVFKTQIQNPTWFI